MKKAHYFHAILGAALLAISLPRAAQADPQLLDRVVAVVNDDAITQSELDTFLRPVYDQLRTEFQGDQLARKVSEARGKLLNQLIEDRLVYQKAKEMKIEINDSELENEMSTFKKRFGGDQKLDEMLKQEGYSLSTIKDRLQRQLMVRRLHDMEVRSKVMVSPKEVDEYYKDHSGEFVSKPRVKVRSMTLKKNEQARDKGLTDEDALKRAKELRAKILKGDDFAKLAAENSEDYQATNGGLSDWIEPGALIDVIDQVIFKLKRGELSDIVETPMGYHIFRVEEKVDGKEQKVEEIRHDISEKIYREKATKRFNEWMEQLKREAYISLR